MFEKVLNNLDYIIGGVAVLVFAALCYGLGSEARTNKLCTQLGGVYVQTWSDGYACIHATEIAIK